MPVPTDPETLLTRDATAAALTESGFPVASTTLATKATRGGGPPFRKFGLKPLYRWGDSIEWAQSKLGPVVTSTSGLDGIDPRRGRPEIVAAVECQSPASSIRPIGSS
jgi:hypothetical protein